MMGLLVIHGAQGGGFSPICIYGGITNQIVARSGLPVKETSIFLASLGYNLLCAIGVFFAFGGRALLGPQRLAAADTGPQWWGRPTDRSHIEGHGTRPMPA